MRNWFTLAGVDSRDFGVYISGHYTFGSPAKQYDEYDIPGRNGLLLGSNRKFENAEYTYKCGIVENFEENMAAFRTFLASLDGYQRLEDTYHPDEYRMAVLMEGIEPDMTQMNTEGEFELRFSCLPQRFLLSGETEYSPFSGTIVGGEVYTDTSTVTDADIRILVDFPYKNGSQREGTQTETPSTNLKLEINGETVWTRTLSARVVEGAFYPATGGVTTKIAEYFPITGWSKLSGTTSTYYVSFVPVGSIIACSCFKFVNSSTTTPGYMYYDSGNQRLVAVASYDINTATKFQQLLQRYPGAYLTETKASTFTWSSSIDIPGGWNTLTAGDYTRVSVAVSNNPTLTNPTRFASKPLIRAYGTGSMSVNGITITVTSCTSYVDIDCDMMDCYEGSTNRNADVAFSTYDFPELAPGDNTFTINSGISAISVIPRWWRL